MLSSPWANRCVNSSTSALPTNRLFTEACFAIPLSSAAKVKILSTDSKSFFVSESVMRTSSVVSLRSLRATSARLGEDESSWLKASAENDARKEIARKHQRRLDMVGLTQQRGMRSSRILVERSPRSMAKSWARSYEGNLPKRERTTWRSLLQLRQFLCGELSRLDTRIFFLDLLVHSLGVERLVGVLVEFDQLQLRRYFADRRSGLVDQLLVENDCFFGAVGLAVKRGESRLGYGGDFAGARRSHLLEATLGSCVVGQVGRSHSQKIMGHVGGAGMRIFVDDSLKLFLGGLSTLFGRSEAGDVRLSRRSSGSQRRVQGTNGLREIEAGFLVLGAQVIPSANDSGENDGNSYHGDDERGTVRDRPIGRLFGGVKGNSAKGILFQVVAGFCAHGLPF